MRAAAVYALGTLDSSQESSTKLISSKLSQAEVPQQGCAGGDQGEYRAGIGEGTDVLEQTNTENSDSTFKSHELRT